MGMAVTGTVSGFSRVMESQRMGVSLTQLNSDLAYAAQMALRDNKTVFVTFLREEDESVPESSEQYRAWRFTTYDVATKKYIPIDIVHRLPMGIVITRQKVFSSALAQEDPDHDTVSIGFRTDGSTTLPKDSKTDWSLTLVLERDLPEIQRGTLPKTSHTLLINPHTGSIAAY